MISIEYSFTIRMKRSILLFFLFLGILSTHTQEDDTSVVEGNKRFAADLYTELTRVEVGNFVFSPFATEILLALIAEGAKGKTKNELVSLLSASSRRPIDQQAFRHIVKNLRILTSHLTLSNLNKIYARNDLHLNREFEQVARSVYDTDIEYVDMKDDFFDNFINNWVQLIFGDPRYHIHPTFIKAHTNVPHRNLILANAISLSAAWSAPFRTRQGIFFNSAVDKVVTNMLTRTHYYNYYENMEMGAKFLEIPYLDPKVGISLDGTGGGLRMVVILPNEKFGLFRLEQFREQLFEPQPYEKYLVQVHIPKFSTQSTVIVDQHLKNMGIDTIFDETKADLSGMSSFDFKRYFVSSITQVASIGVNEYGTDATASSSGVLPTRSLDPNGDYRFNADHPFLYYIHMDGIIIFSGRIINM